MTLYPKLKKKLGLIGAVCLIVWGLFILGMQVYVFCYYSQVYGEGKGIDGKDTVWSKAYNGMGLANAADCLLFGFYYLIVFAEGQTTTKALLWGIILAVVGAVAAAASTVLAAIESDWLNTATSDSSTHPCKFQDTVGYPDSLTCTNWLALQVTLAVLSGLAFSEYIFIGCVIFMGLSGGKHGAAGQTEHVPITRAQTQQPNSNNKANKGYEGPYNAYNQSPPPTQKVSSQSQSSYDDFNPQYSYHLQQLTLQQQAQSKQQQQPQQPNMIPRGRLQTLHNQRQQAPPVPAKPTNNNQSNMYRY